MKTARSEGIRDGHRKLNNYMLHEEEIFSGSTALIPVEPLGQRFTALFPHPWGFIHKNVEDSDWQTETAYPLDPRNLWARWQNPKSLVGVRFGSQTRYAMIDIDIGSAYHPAQDPTALNRITQALEGIGIYRSLLIRSSDSGGLHLYLPFGDELPTYGVALALKHCLTDAGFPLAAGQVETFPNCKAYSKRTITSYQAHRLPLQAGSYLLNQAGEIASGDLSHFLAAWQSAASGNPTDEIREAIAAATAASKLNYQTEGRSARKWCEESEQVIRAGWTGPGQTNELLKIMARYAVVFKALSGEALVQYVVETATNSPGYQEWCQHQHEIDRRARHWASECEKYYRPYLAFPAMGNPWRKKRSLDRRKEQNAKQAVGAIDRIKQAVTSIAVATFTTVRDLASTIAATAKCSIQTLYRNLALWHPEHLEECNGQDEHSEGNPEGDPPPHATPLKSLKPLQGNLLHPFEPKKVLNAVTLKPGFKTAFGDSDRGNRAPRGFPFSEQNRSNALPESDSPPNVVEESG